jgi:DNA recombination protein RmuC
MNDFYVNFFIGFLTALLIGFVLFWRFYIQKEKESRALIEAYQAMAIEHAVAQEKISSIQTTNVQLKEQFENIAHSILEKNSKRMLDENQTSLAQILQPFKENIHAFNKKIETYYHDESKERFSLIKEIEKLQLLNQKISDDANNLTNALRGDNKIQGDWGEYILERVLESSGLKKGREYEIQKEFKGVEGEKLRPDVIVHLPDKKDIIIDSKLSLVSYERFHVSTDPEDREENLLSHLYSINNHIKQLSTKRYQDIPNINTLDFVLMFIPIEAAFLLAVEKDRTLYERAYRQNIIIVSPSTLLAVLRTIQNSWRYEYQNKNAQMIAKKAGDMHDKFVSFVDDMLLVEKSLIKAQSSYGDAFKKLSSGKGNLVNRSRELKELDGVYHKKEQNKLLEE